MTVTWTVVATDGEPAEDLSGNLTPYFISDGVSVSLGGRLNNRWILKPGGPENVTHYALVELPDAP